MNQTPCLRIFILEPVLAAEVMSCALSPFPHLVEGTAVRAGLCGCLRAGQGDAGPGGCSRRANMCGGVIYVVRGRFKCIDIKQRGNKKHKVAILMPAKLVVEETCK